MKMIWICALFLALSAMIADRSPDAFVAQAHPSDLAALASLYNKTDPHILTTAFTPTEATGSQRARSTVAQLKEPRLLRNREMRDFSEYVFLHYSRVEAMGPADITTARLTSH